MHRVRPICFNRRRRLRLRRLVRADLPGLRWLDARRLTRRIEALPGAETIEELIQTAPQTQVGIELDHQLVGALLAAPTASRPPPVAQPWDRLDEELPALAVDLTGPVLRGCGAIWRDVLSAEEIAQVLTVGRQALVQQLGLDGALSIVEAPGWAKWRSAMSSQAYVQQVHGGGFGDWGVKALIAQGWVVRGFWERGDVLEIAMWWGNRVR